MAMLNNQRVYTMGISIVAHLACNNSFEPLPGNRIHIIDA
jgi:hypothetical protein